MNISKIYTGAVWYCSDSDDIMTLVVKDNIVVGMGTSTDFGGHTQEEAILILIKAGYVYHGHDQYWYSADK